MIDGGEGDVAEPNREAPETPAAAPPQQQGDGGSRACGAIRGGDDPLGALRHQVIGLANAAADPALLLRMPCESGTIVRRSRAAQLVLA